MLDADDFESWPAVMRRFPGWTPDEVERLERDGRKVGSVPTTWRCRAAPLPSTRWCAVETRSYTDKRWLPLPSTKDCEPWRSIRLGLPLGASVALRCGRAVLSLNG